MKWKGWYDQFSYLFKAQILDIVQINPCSSQVKIALDWLRGDRVEYRRFAAVLILKVRPTFSSHSLLINQITKSWSSH